MPWQPWEDGRDDLAIPPSNRYWERVAPIPMPMTGMPVPHVQDREHGRASRPIRLAVLAPHPVHYTCALLRRVAHEPDIDLTAFFGSDITVRPHHDSGFGARIEWDVPLLDGFRHELLPAWGRSRETSFWWPFVRGVGRRLAAGRFDWLLVHGYNRPAHWLAMAQARRRGIGVMIRDEANAISRPRGMFKRAVKPLYFALLDRAADRFLSVGTLNAAYYRALGIPDAKIVPVPWAVDNGFFQAEDEAFRDGAGRAELRRRLGIPAGNPVILYAARLQRRKLPDLLLDAFRNLSPAAAARDPHLVFVGEGAMAAPLRAAAAGLGGVHFAGFQGQRAMRQFYDLCDVFVLPSMHEPWGLVVNEAMNLGRPVVVSDQVGSGPDLVRDGENGFVVPAGDVGALAAALSALLADPGRARRMGRRSREIIDGWDFEADVRGLRRALGLSPAAPAGGLAA